MNTDRKRLLHQVATYRTFLRSVPGRNFNYLTTSTRSLVVKHLNPHTPSTVVNSLCNLASGKTVYVQVLNDNQAISVDKLSSNFMPEVPSLISNMLVQTSNFPTKTPISFTPSLLFGKDSLQSDKSFFRVFEPTRGFYQFAFTGSDDRSNSKVYPNRWLPVARYRSILELKRKSNIPFIYLSGDRNSFDYTFPWDFSMPSDLDTSNILNIKSILFQRSAVSESEFDSPETIKRLKSRQTCFKSISSAGEKPLITLFNPTKNLLRSGKVKQFHFRDRRTNVSQLYCLFVIRNRFSMLLPSSSSLLNSSIIEPTSERKKFKKSLFLILSGINTILKTSFHSIFPSVPRYISLRFQQRPVPENQHSNSDSTYKVIDFATKEILSADYEQYNLLSGLSHRQASDTKTSLLRIDAHGQAELLKKGFPTLSLPLSLLQVLQNEKQLRGLRLCVGILGRKHNDTGVHKSYSLMSSLILQRNYTTRNLVCQGINNKISTIPLLPEGNSPLVEDFLWNESGAIQKYRYSKRHIRVYLTI